MRGEWVGGEEGEREESRRRNFQFPVMFSGPAATGEESRPNVMGEAALGLTFSGKRGYKMVHKLLVPHIKEG